MNPSCYYVKAGYGNKTIDQINSEVSEKFPDKTIDKIQANLPEDGIISYAYFLKKLEFPISFKLCDEEHEFQNIGKMKFFETDIQKHREQVRIHNYGDEKNFVIELMVENRGTKENFYLMKF